MLWTGLLGVLAAWLARKGTKTSIILGLILLGVPTFVLATQGAYSLAATAVLATWIGGFGAYGGSLARPRNRWDAPDTLRWAVAVGVAVVVAGLAGAGIRSSMARQAEPLQAGPNDHCNLQPSPRKRFQCRVLREFKAEFPEATAHWAGGIEVGLGVGEGSAALTLSDLRFEECSQNPKHCRARLEPLFEQLRAAREN